MKTIILALAMTCAYAAPITSGTITFDGQLPVTFDFWVDGYNAVGSYRAGFLSGQCQPCAPGDSVMVYGMPGGSDFYGQWAPPSGGLLPFSRFEFGGPGVQLTGVGTFFGTFALTGQLCCIGPNSTLLADLVGTGTIAITAVDEPSMFGPRLRMTSAVMTFEAPAIHNPEPAPFVLTGLGLAAAVMARRMRISARR